jgi:hypothetical protein
MSVLRSVTGVSRFIGVLEATSEPYWDDTPIWKDEVFPCRTKIEVIAALTPETAVPLFELKDKLTSLTISKTPQLGRALFVARQQDGNLLPGKQWFT